MDTLLEQLSSNFEDSFSPINYLLYISLCAALLYILSVVYNRYGQSMSNRSQLSKVLVIVGLTTFIIISIVKSSLALSLGLVGALSIVRFRTAIKEPEELGYFFMAIAIGLGMGANQLLPTILGFVFLMLIVILLNRSKMTSISQNLLLTLDSPKTIEPNFVENLSAKIASQTEQLELKRWQQQGEALTINFHVKVNSLEKINAIYDDLRNLDNGIQIVFVDHVL